MTIQYHIYKNDGAAGPIDYSSVVATVSGTSYATAALALSSDNAFGVRAFDTGSGLEESNVDARVRIVVGPSGADLTGVPTSPTLLGVVPLSGGVARVDWAWSASPGSSPATSFAVYLTVGTAVDYTASPAATVTVVRGVRAYSTTLTGLADGTTYAVGVRAVNATGHDSGTSATLVIGSGTPPAGVTGLTATPTILPGG